MVNGIVVVTIFNATVIGIDVVVVIAIVIIIIAPVVAIVVDVIVIVDGVNLSCPDKWILEISRPAFVRLAQVAASSEINIKLKTQMGLDP